MPCIEGRVKQGTLLAQSAVNGGWDLERTTGHPVRLKQKLKLDEGAVGAETARMRLGAETARTRHAASVSVCGGNTLAFSQSFIDLELRPCPVWCS